MSKIVLITGGNSGIGYSTARLFKKKGYVVFIAGRNVKRVNQAASELDVIPLVADMTIPKDMESLASNFHETGLDVLVNNAAAARFSPLSDMTKSHFTELFETNVFGPMMLVKELLPALEKKQGSIVNVSSVITSKGVVNGSLYAATKGAMDAATRSLALELAPRKIRVNVVAPGAIDTPIIQKTGLDDQQIKELRVRQEANIPMHRYGNPEEVAQVILGQAESTYVTGSIWRVDGGVDT